MTAALRAARPLLAAGALLASSAGAWAHPDIAIEDRVAFIFSDARVSAIEETWIFDPGYSLSFLEDYGTKPGASIPPAAREVIAKRIQPNLAEVRYFTYVRLDGRDLGNLPVRDFVASTKDGHLIFTFVVDLPAPVDPLRQDLRLEIYDHDYYAAIELADPDPVQLRNPGRLACEPKVRDDAENAYFGNILPQEITLSCR
jgi:ABC-type uncharacterized transport system substrate-binding protein